MTSQNDLPWHSVKEIYARKIEELSLLWQCGPKKRRVGHSNGIYKLSDPKCCASNLGIHGAVLAPMVDAILSINRSKDLIRPKKITHDEFGWITKPHLEFYVDFEYISDIFYDGPDPYLTDEKTPKYTYLIGLVWVVDGKSSYRSFVMKDLSEESERKMVDEFISFLDSLRKKYHCNPNIYHWGRAEQSTFRGINKKHQNRWETCNLKWTDMLRIFKNKQQPIVVKGAWKYGIKEIAKAMHKNGMIPNIWDSKCANGMSAMLDGYQSYKYSLNYNKPIMESLGMKDIVEYNKVDCMVMLHIMKYLRDHLC
jgi:hypothetical protein